MSLGAFSQTTNLTPVIRPVNGDTLYTWNHVQAKVIAKALQERTNYAETVASQNNLIGTYRRESNEKSYMITELENQKKAVGKLYSTEMQKFQTCETDRIGAVADRDKYSKKLKSARTKMLIGYGLAAVLFTTTIIK